MLACCFEQLNFFMTLIAGRVLLRDRFLCRRDNGKTENERKKAKSREGEPLCAHGETSSEGNFPFLDFSTILLQGELKLKKNYLAPTRRTTAVHPKRMTKKSTNCLTSLGSINPPCIPKSWRYFVFFLKIGNRKYSFLIRKPL